jgi:glucose-1-phosphate adenylyltransferase
MKKKCVAMILAGGQGSRLYVLTTKVAKPAVPFGGKYRIIDFTLSNCANSNIDTVGILTQYRPQLLNAYIGNGQPWDLDRGDGGVHVLQPYMTGSSGEWYRGTANAIYQNLDFIDLYDPEYVVILSGDHIYKMDYSQMVSHHIKTGAAVTIAVIEVEWDEAPRFGIMAADADGRIVDFEEKPQNPKSNLASMGVYVFSADKLKQYLIEDENDNNSSNDFGGDIIPKMLGNGEKLQAYRYTGYWKDVGTINSLWDANMDILSQSSFDIYDSKWKVYSRDYSVVPHFIGRNGQVNHSIITAGCEIEGDVSNSVLFNNVTVSERAAVRYSVIMPGVTIEAGAVVEYSIIAENAHVKSGARIGADPKDYDVNKWGLSVIAENVTICDNAVIPPASMVDDDIGQERSLAIEEDDLVLAKA